MCFLILELNNKEEIKVSMTKVGIELILRGKVKRGFSGSISSVWLGVVLIL